MFTSSLCIFPLVIYLLLLKNDVSAQTAISPCPNHFTYQFIGGKVEGIVTLPAIKGTNNLQVQVVFMGNYDQNNVVKIDFDDERTARQSYKNGGNVRYKIEFPENLEHTPKILSMILNEEQYCDNPNALVNGKLTILGLNFMVNPVSYNKISTPTPTARPTARPAPRPVFPNPTARTRPQQATTQRDDFELEVGNIELDFSALSTQRPSINNQVPTNHSDKNWLETFPFNKQCGVHFTATHTIINGKELAANEFPWLVALFNHNREYFCGGTLVSDKHVITAAHCCVDQKWIFLEFGKHLLPDTREAGSVMTISHQIINHPDYVPNTGHADIALIILEEKVTFTEKIKPICLWPFATHRTGVRGTVAGWGNDISGSKTDVPMAAEVSIVSDEECLKSNKLFESITSASTFCAGGKNTGPCRGDSGAGFILNEKDRWYLKGIISVSLSSNPSGGFCDVNKFAVYCDVGKYLGWLQNYLV